MNAYQIKIELLSESILGSGESVAGYIDLDVLHDELGIPYFKAKTLKGRLREEAENIIRLQSRIFDIEQIDRIFGKIDNENNTSIAFSNCTISENVRKAIKASDIEGYKILNALTDIRTFTAIDKEGISKDSTLRQFRVINKGLKLFSDVTLINELEEKDILLFELSVLALKHIGLLCSRGKGNVQCTLLKDGVDIKESILSAMRGGRNN